LLLLQFDREKGLVFELCIQASPHAINNISHLLLLGLNRKNHKPSLLIYQLAETMPISKNRGRGLGRESGDRIKGCDGTWIHAVGSIAGADGWNVTNVAAFPISSAVTAPANLPHLPGARGQRRGFLQLAP
jgi:hypothetical protein